MAKSVYNSLNFWRGRIAGQVYKSVRGKQVISTFVVPKNPKTSAQQLSRAKLTLLGTLGSVLRYVIREGFKGDALAHRSTPKACFIKRHYDKVQGTSAENVAIAPEQLILSHGSRTNVFFSDTIDASSVPQQVTLTITDGMTIYDDELNDKVYGALYCEDLNQVILSLPVTRTTDKIDITVPKAWTGLEVHAYGFVVSKDGNQSSPSTYIGHTTIS